MGEPERDGIVQRADGPAPRVIGRRRIVRGVAVQVCVEVDDVDPAGIEDRVDREGRASDRRDRHALDFFSGREVHYPQLEELAHVRVHPLLQWTEVDIWLYIQREEIPVVPLYFARDGKRFRSLGEKGITFPIDSDASNIEEIIAELETIRTAERAGRAMDHESEDAFERLRAHGYM